MSLLVASASHLPLAGLLLGIGALLVLAQATRVPYPLLLVVGGSLLALVPGAPQVSLDPDVVLLVFLPVLLYAAAFFSSLRDLREQARPITTLAVGLVVATAAVVATVAHVGLGMDWGPAFVLGAVLSPTDPVAATAIARRVGAPRRVITIVEGEALINDSSALIVYKFAVLAVVSGTFSLGQASLDFGVGVLGGLAVGIGVGMAIVAVRRRITDTTTEIAVSLLTPYLAYLPAESFGVSAVVAAVTSGIWLGWRSPWLVTSTYRLQAYSVWEVLQFVANAALFALIGMELPTIVDQLEAANLPPRQIVADGLLVAAVVMGTRIAWVATAEFTARHVPGMRRLRPVGSGREAVVIAWTGMRGAVSLATALAIPLAVDGGGGFAERDRIVLIAYVAILTTLLAQGLTLPWLLRALGFRGEDGDASDEEARARAALADAVLDRFDVLVGEHDVEAASVEAFRARYRFRQKRHRARGSGDADARLEDRNDRWVAFHQALLDIERVALLDLRQTGAIADPVLQRIQYDLDLEEQRLRG